MDVFRTRRRVEFADTDLEGLVHFARYLVFMETAEHERLRAAGVEITGAGLVWPRVKIACDYLAPLRYGDTVEIEVRVAKLGRSSITWEHTLLRVETAEGRAAAGVEATGSLRGGAAQGGGQPGLQPAERRVARGEVTVVCCRRTAEGGLTPEPLPEALVERLAETPGDARGSATST